MATLKLEIEIPLISRSDRFIVANGETYFVGCTGAHPIEFNLFNIDEHGNRVFSEGFDSLEKLSTATYDFIGNFEVLK